MVNTFNNTGEWVMQGDSRFGGNVLSAVNNIGTSTNPIDTTCSVAVGGCVTMVERGAELEPSPDPATAGVVFHVIELNGLETFNNNGGLITMINGNPTDRIVLANYAGKQVYFNGTGNSRLGVDAFLGGAENACSGTCDHNGHFRSSADVLQVGKFPGQGYVTGLTHVIVNDTNPLPGVFNPIGIPVVESGGAANVVIGGKPANVAGNFDLPQGPIQKGLFDFNLFFLPKNTAGNPCQNGFNCWFLASTPSTTAFELPRLLFAAETVWHDAAGVWLDRTADLRDYYFTYGLAPVCDPNVVRKAPCVAPAVAPGVGPGAWIRAFGDWASDRGTSHFTQFNLTLDHDVRFNQSTGGVQLGGDYAILNRPGFDALLVGVLAGAVDSSVRFKSGTRVEFEGGNVGAYATYLNRAFFWDALALANFMSVRFNSGPDFATSNGLIGLTARSDVEQIGGHIDAGYRFQFGGPAFGGYAADMPVKAAPAVVPAPAPGWFIEPQATVEFVHTEFRNFNFFPGCDEFASARLRNDEAQGRLGLRLGTVWDWYGWRVEPSATASVWEIFTGRNFATLSSDGFVLDLSDPHNNRTYGEVGAALNFFQVAGWGPNWPGRWSAFVKGDFRFADNYDAGSVKGGVRVQW
jgi:hypothetical protein